MNAISNWLESHIQDVRLVKHKYNIIMAREFSSLLCGIDNRMPWYVVEDLIYFKKITSGSIVVMGRNTMESLNCKPLPGRVNVVISSTMVKPPEGFVLIRHIEEVANFMGSIFFIGGPSLLGSIVDKHMLFPNISLFLTELQLPWTGELNGKKIYLHDSHIFGRRRVSREFCSGWLDSEFANTKVKFEGFTLS